MGFNWIEIYYWYVIIHRIKITKISGKHQSLFLSDSKIHQRERMVSLVLYINVSQCFMCVKQNTYIESLQAWFWGFFIL